MAIFPARWDLGHEANPKNPKSMLECLGLVVPWPNAPKFGKLHRKNIRKPHFREREGKKVTNRPRTVGLPVRSAHHCMPPQPPPLPLLAVTPSLV